MRAFLIGIAVAAIGWETGSMAAEPPAAARSVQLISMGATNPQRPLRAGEDVEDEAPQAADHAALPALPPAFRIHDLSRRWVAFQLVDSFSAAPEAPARTSVAQPSVPPSTGLLPAAGANHVTIWIRSGHIYELASLRYKQQ